MQLWILPFDSSCRRLQKFLMDFSFLWTKRRHFLLSWENEVAASPQRSSPALLFFCWNVQKAIWICCVINYRHRRYLRINVTLENDFRETPLLPLNSPCDGNKTLHSMIITFLRLIYECKMCKKSAFMCMPMWFTAQNNKTRIKREKPKNVSC